MEKFTEKAKLTLKKRLQGIDELLDAGASPGTWLVWS
jgi:hypothetical protein